VRLESEQFATFVPADPPRAGALAVWGDGQGPDELDLVLPAAGECGGGGSAGGCCRSRRRCRRCWHRRRRRPAPRWRPGRPRRRPVSGWSRGGACCLPPARRVRRVAGRAAGRGRPGLAAADRRRDAAAGACPARGRAAPAAAALTRGVGRELWDAIADSLVRSPAAVHATGARAFAAAEPVRSGSLPAGWPRPTGGWTPGRRCSSGSSCRPRRRSRSPRWSRCVAWPTPAWWWTPASCGAPRRWCWRGWASAPRPTCCWPCGAAPGPGRRWRRCCARRRRPRSASTRSRWPSCWRPAPRRSAVPASRSCGRPSCSAKGWTCDATVATPKPAGAAAPVFRLEALLTSTGR
jgi:hypothetical protein